jgi:CDP-glycerol glycerophosphotransferase
MPRITVIVPFRNTAATLPAAVGSVVDQRFDFRDIELLLVDDGSTDGSVEIAERLARRHPNIRLLKASGGTGAPGEARNIGLDNAQAPYVMFLDSDDAYRDNACAFLLEKIEETGSDVSGGSYLVEEDGELRVPPLFPAILKDPVVNQPVADCPLLMLLPPIIQAKIFSLSFLREKGIRFPEGIRTDDAVFSARAMLAAAGVSMFNTPVYRYVPRREAGNPSITQSLDRRYVRDFCAGRAMIREAFRAHGALDYLELRYPQDVGFIMQRYLSLPEDRGADRLAVLGVLAPFFADAALVNMDRYSKWEEVLIRLVSRARFAEVLELQGLHAQAGARGR